LFKHAVHFFVDSIQPEISLTFPQNNTRYNLTWINITGTANDTNIDTVRINDTENFGQNLGTYQSWNFTNISIAEGSYSLKITANDSVGNENSVEVHFTIGVWDITFHIYSGEDGTNLSSVSVSCNNSWSGNIDSGDTVGFTTGDYSCTFEKKTPSYYNKTVTFSANDDKTVDVKMSLQGELTTEEHSWLEYLYDCWSTGDCRDTLNSIETMVVYVNQTTEEIKETVNKVWDQFEQTDESVVNETRVSMVVNDTSNITINYSINVPVKQDYEFLPIRIFYWFLSEDNTTCYGQAKDSDDAESPYCKPLIAHTIGEVNTIVKFTVEMRPSLSAGNYTIVRRIDIDPDDIWINYGHEAIGTVEVTEDSSKASVGLKVAKTTTEPSEMEVQPDGMTGEVTGFTFDSGTVSLIISVVALAVVLVYTISRRRTGY
jgi:hypothetical protein